MPTIPPWLNVQPSDFAAAGERGLGLGVQAAGVASSAATARARTALEAQRIADQHSEEQAQIALAGQRLAQQERQAKIEMAASQQQQERDFLLAQQRNQIADAYHTATVGLQKQKLEAASAAAAKKFAAQQKLGALLQSGVPMDKALAQVPELIGAGVETQMTKTATSRPGVEHMADIDKLQYATAQKDLTAAQKDLDGAVMWWTKRAAREKVKAAQDKLDSITGKYGKGGAPGATHRFDPKTGKIEPIAQQEDESQPAGNGWNPVPVEMATSE